VEACTGIFGLGGQSRPVPVFLRDPMSNLYVFDSNGNYLCDTKSLFTALDTPGARIHIYPPNISNVCCSMHDFTYTTESKEESLTITISGGGGSLIFSGICISEGFAKLHRTLKTQAGPVFDVQNALIIIRSAQSSHHYDNSMSISNYGSYYCICCKRLTRPHDSWWVFVCDECDAKSV
jgi:hypothetical protein